MPTRAKPPGALVTARSLPGGGLGSSIVTDAAGGTHHARPGLAGRLRETVGVLYREALKFGLVGLGAFVVDAGVFNLLVYGHGDHSALHHKPLTAKVISVSLSIVVAWLGNRFWAFRHRIRPRIHHELASFLVVNLIGMAISLACLGFSRYVLGLESTLADNVSGTLIGTALGTLFRWWAYRRFIFTEAIDPVVPVQGVDPVQPVQPVQPGEPGAPGVATPRPLSDPR
jgi:putative flippase GtrA